jgi:hypothetical protein
MRTLDLHRDVGAYALGVLDPAAAFRFEDHLMDCPRCMLQLSEFSGVRAQLDRYRRLTPAGVPLFAERGQALLRALLDHPALDRRRHRRRRIALIAAAAALVVGGPLAAISAVSGNASPDARWTAANPATGTSAVVTAERNTWGTDIALQVTERGGYGVCSLIAVGRDGSLETVTTWAAPTAATKSLVTRGGSALPLDRIDHFEVRASDGRTLVTIAPPAAGPGQPSGTG